MKKLMMILAILVTFAIGASAQTPSVPVSIYAGGAMSIPTSDFAVAFNNGYHGSLGVGFNVSPMIQFIAKAEYHAFKLDLSDPAFDGYGGGTNKVIMFGGDLQFSPSFPSLPIAPYILGGAGMANIKQSELTGPPSLALDFTNSLISESQTKMYWDMGAGFQMKTGPKLSLFAQARYVNIVADGGNAAFIPVTVGVKFF